MAFKCASPPTHAVGVLAPRTVAATHSDTYIVDKGQIVTQTVHDTFKSAPGFTCPVAAPGT